MTGRPYRDPITRCRDAATAIRTEAQTLALDLLRNFDGKDPSALVQGSGQVKGMLSAADRFEAEVKEAFGAENEEDREEREAR